MKSLRKLVVLLVVVGVFGALPASAQIITENTPEPTAPPPVEILIPEILATHPHDPAAFTQGLLLQDGTLYESTGLYGQSSLREVDPETGEVLREVDLPEEVFAEGLTLVDDHLLQLTWQEHLVYSYDFDSFEPLTTFEDYPEEGWGICYDGESLYTSDGSDQIIVRDPDTLEELDRLDVRVQGQVVNMINELECVGDFIYANIWQTDYIVRIDKADGNVSAVIDAQNLLTAEQRATLASGSVLNGIAYDPESETFLITGKRWSWLFEVQFVEP
ncbi:MAG: glutaminyl-peptide cyclotransferase [Chloroflexota bacterium]